MCEAAGVTRGPSERVMVVTRTIHVLHTCMSNMIRCVSMCVCMCVCEAVGDTLVREEGGNRSPLGGNQQMGPHWRYTDQDRLKHDGRCFEG